MVTQSNHNDTRNIYASSKKTRSKKELNLIAKEQYDIDLDEALDFMENEPYDKDYEDYLVRMVEEAEESRKNGVRLMNVEESRRLIYEQIFNEKRI